MFQGSFIIILCAKYYLHTFSEETCCPVRNISGAIYPGVPTAGPSSFIVDVVDTRLMP